ncbi:MAG: cytochrome c4 [Candidatus Rokubacteria bacterium]|nr:cytochrome c4 [Candidatus Rokubacteria bacterium]
MSQFLILAMLILAVAAAPEARAVDAEAGRRKAEVCAQCHGAAGNSTNPLVPSLAAQPALYTHWQLILFRDGRRKDPQMTQFAVNLSDTDMEDLSVYFAVQTPVVASGPGDPGTTAAGKRLVEAHHCNSCHAPGLVGQQHIPRLAGQHYEYLLKQLRGFKAQTRAELDGSMTTAAQPLSEEDIENLARYIAGLQPAP